MESVNYDIFSAMQAGEPFKTYKKNILGKVYVTVWNSFSNKPEGKILHGNPKNNDKDCLVDIWSVQEDVFFRRMNDVHFSKGNLTEYVKPEEKDTKKSYSDYTDDDIKEILNNKFYGFIRSINEIESEALLFRMLNMARELDKSEKIVDRIESRISEVQYGKPVAE